MQIILLENIVNLGGLGRSEEHTSELQSRPHLVCCLLLEKKKQDGRVTVEPVEPRHDAHGPDYTRGSVHRPRDLSDANGGVSAATGGAAALGRRPTAIAHR